MSRKQLCLENNCIPHTSYSPILTTLLSQLHHYLMSSIAPLNDIADTHTEDSISDLDAQLNEAIQRQDFLAAHAIKTRLVNAKAGLPTTHIDTGSNYADALTVRHTIVSGKTTTSKVAPAPCSAIPGSPSNSPPSTGIPPTRTSMVRNNIVHAPNKAPLVMLRPETETHHGYHPSEWKKCANVTGTIFWIHRDRGAISHHDPKELCKEHIQDMDEGTRRAFNKAFRKVHKVTDDERRATIRANRLEEQRKEQQCNVCPPDALCCTRIGLFSYMFCPCTAPFFIMQVVYAPEMAIGICRKTFPRPPGGLKGCDCITCVCCTCYAVNYGTEIFGC